MPGNDCSCTFDGMHLCDSLDFLWIAQHAFFAEFGTTECELGTFHLTLYAIENKTTVAGYLHEVQEIGTVSFFRVAIYT